MPSNYDFIDQPIGFDDTGRGTARFKENRLVRSLTTPHLSRGFDGLNELARQFHRDEYAMEWRQLNQLIGYSVSGYGDMSLFDMSYLCDNDNESPPTHPHIIQCDRIVDGLDKLNSEHHNGSQKHPHQPLSGDGHFIPNRLVVYCYDRFADHYRGSAPDVIQFGADTDDFAQLMELLGFPPSTIIRVLEDVYRERSNSMMISHCNRLKHYRSLL